MYCFLYITYCQQVSPLPAEWNMLVQLAQCTQKKVPQTLPWAIWEPLAEIGQTARAPLFQQNPISAKIYLETMRGKQNIN